MEIDESIKKTIRYSQKYQGKLTLKQLHNRLIGKTIYPLKKIEERLRIILPPQEEILLKKENNKYCFDKRKKAKYFADKFLKNDKNILFVGITGSVAAGYPKKNDDIDLMVITKMNKLWVSRLKIRILMLINNIPYRKFGAKERKDDFCFNLWLDEKSIKLDKSKESQKNAIDLIMLVPLINKNYIYEKFLVENSWVNKWVATGYDNKIKKINVKINTNKTTGIEISSFLNYFFYITQYFYMKKKIKNEKITLHEAFFHR